MCNDTTTNSDSAVAILVISAGDFGQGHVIWCHHDARTRCDLSVLITVCSKVSVRDVNRYVATVPPFELVPAHKIGMKNKFPRCTPLRAEFFIGLHERQSIDVCTLFDSRATTRLDLH